MHVEGREHGRRFARHRPAEALHGAPGSEYEPLRAEQRRLQAPPPGETEVIADLQGPGVVTHIWFTGAANEFAWPRLFRLRAYYDGKKTPSVDAPLGDFFGVGNGYEADLNSSMVRDTSLGRARNSYWPMPFRKSCRITVTNEGRRMKSLYFHVDWRKYDALPDDVGISTRIIARNTRPSRAATTGS